MADRVKYFLLGVLFLVVAGVIAYDKWNSAGEPKEIADLSPGDTGGDWDVSVPPIKVEAGKEEVPATPQGQKQLDLPAQPEPSPKEGGAGAPAERVTPPAEERKPDAPVPAKTHVIRKGQTLEAIAIEYYGTREGVGWIVEANRLANPHKIFVNQKLIIPAKKEIAKEPAKKEGVAAEKPGGAKAGGVPTRYRVKKGDGDLYAICRRLYGREGQGARVARIMELNHLYSADVKTGTLLILPAR